MDQLQEEAKARWGETPEYKESTRRTSKYSHADFDAAKLDQEAATEQFVTAFGNSYAITSPEARSAVVAHRAAISKWFYDCSVEMQKNLALLYISDPRFTAYYDSRLRGLAQYVHDCIMAQ